MRRKYCSIYNQYVEINIFINSLQLAKKEMDTAQGSTVSSHIPPIALQILNVQNKVKVAMRSNKCKPLLHYAT